MRRVFGELERNAARVLTPSAVDAVRGNVLSLDLATNLAALTSAIALSALHHQGRKERHDLRKRN